MKTIKELDIKNKRVIIRVDFNVPIKDGVILDDNRIKKSLKTINYAIKNNSKVILLSHLGRVKSVEDLKNSLYPVSIRLSELLNKDVIFINETKGEKLENAINNLKDGEVLLVENTRFEDLDSKAESNNDLSLSKYWASLGDVFINDAFGVIHRSCASNSIATYLESGIGFLVEEELSIINSVITNPKRPFTVILGGAKVSDKIGLIENLINVADYILIGGAMANTFLKASGINVGSSLVEDDKIPFCKKVLLNDKIILPIDVTTQNSTYFITDIKNEDKIYDIGPKTVSLFKQYLDSSNTIIFNGPVGMFEEDKYSNGSKGICEVLKNNDGVKIAGGGDTASFIINNSYEAVFTHISTGGGATLELLEGKTLPGLEVIK